MSAKKMLPYPTELQTPPQQKKSSPQYLHIVHQRQDILASKRAREFFPITLLNDS
jgi:hypothetical protein